MNKKLLFAAMSLAALTACTNDDFESKQQIAQESSPIQFEVINNGMTRASMDGNKIKWSATDGDRFTLYYGGAAAAAVTGFDNAIYTASEEEGKAVLKTPTMITAGRAIMVWPLDSTFRITSGDNISIKIPAELDNVEKNIPYVSDQFNIAAYTPTGAYNTAGLNRSYPVFMRPMASQINLIADYDGTDATLATLYGGDDPIAEIVPKTVDLLTTEAGGGDDFTTQINLAFAAPSGTIATQWATVANNAWESVTGFGATSAQSVKLTTKCIENDKKTCKFLILPQAVIPAAGLKDGGIVVNTNYGKVVIANAGDVDDHGTEYDNSGTATDEIGKAWYRFVTNPATPGALVAGETAAATPEASGEHAGKYKVTSEPKIGMMQTINALSAYTAQSGVVKGEPVGAAATRYVKVLLSHLDMSGLHLDTDKELYDAVRVWDKMGLSSVTVYLDGQGADKQFTMSQKTIAKINAINAAATGGRYFHVQPCNAEEVCNEIVITGGDKIQDLTFIVKNGAKKADVVLAKDFTWNWDGTIKLDAVGNTGIQKIINRGTLENNEDNTLKTVQDNAPTYTQVNIEFVNDGIWNIAAKVNVQNAVTNNGVVNIAEGARYLQDGGKFGAASLFINEAKTLPERFGVANEQIGKVNNNGTFATVAKGEINNYGLIEHANDNCKTYITRNQIGTGFNANFNYVAGTGVGANKIGRINIPWDDESKKASNVSISAGTSDGFVSLTVKNVANLNASTVGSRINYIIVKEGVGTISAMPSPQIKYVEFDSDKEIAWNLGDGATETFEGLVVLSDVNVKIKNTVNVNTSVYLNADMYVAGNTNITKAKCDGYFGDTQNNWDKMYIEW